MKLRHASALILAFIAMAACEAPAGKPRQTEGDRLHGLFHREWEHAMRESPQWASALGDLRYNDRWESLSIESFKARHEHDRQLLRELDSFDPARLSEADRLNLRLFRRQNADALEMYPYQWHLLPLTHRGGPQTLHDLADSLRFETVKDYEDWLSRMRAVPEHLEQATALMREGMRLGMVHARVVMRRVPKQVRSQLVKDPTESLFYKPFTHMPESLPEADRTRLQEEAQAVIARRIVPVYRAFLEFFEEEYLPACTVKVGVWQLPRGQEMYAAMARRHTTTKLTAHEIHEIGLSEVARIRAEMEQVIEQVGFEGTFEEFLVHLRTDPKFYYKDPQQLLEAYRALSKEIDPLVVKLFRTLPRMPYGVEPIPDQVAPDTTTAYYQGPAADGSRAGAYFVNLHKPETRPIYEMEALSLHEAVPGHHFQIALAMELGDLPAFRKHARFTAYIEGWGLYAESLGEELGLYKDPYSKFGQLTYEMWRACRLVVDTGMHHHAWTRRQAIDFMKANTAKSELDIVNEVDRYIAWPGQALAYKIGELKIQELRKKAAQALGDRFDIRDYHEVVLLSGAVPLDVLEENVTRWMDRTLQDAGRKPAAATAEVKPESPSDSPRDAPASKGKPRRRGPSSLNYRGR